ncbi:MAG: RAQPRD family integrative conjugative element protein [Candidatus Accumulibacter sp.]|jgi:RAQPRD family integrative conjugative element protein|nr:RAQPRD family integrative conjugative element protein [Accumulibacter sp.]
MFPSRIPVAARRLLAALLLAVPGFVLAGDGPERERLAAILRQLDGIDRQAEHAAQTASRERARYHFDYVRLREDLARLRAGLQDYLAPPRAQPRDPLELSGDYRQPVPSRPEATP